MLLQTEGIPSFLCLNNTLESVCVCVCRHIFSVHLSTDGYLGKQCCNECRAADLLGRLISFPLNIYPRSGNAGSYGIQPHLGRHSGFNARQPQKQKQKLP